jgi:hypothetical protein
VGVVDADALPTSEKLRPAAPSIFTAAALLVRFCFEACLTRDMVASSVSSCEIARQSSARRNRRARVTLCHKRETSHRVPFVFMARAAVVIKPVSDDSLRETGIFADTAGDFRQFALQDWRIGNPETKPNARNAGIRPYLAFPEELRRTPQCLAGGAVLIEPVSRQNPC